MTYQEFISPFQIYDSQYKAQAKGYDAHHIIPKKAQKEKGITDNRCVRLLPSEHAYAHILWDLENEIKTADFFLHKLGLQEKNLEEISYEDCLAYNDWDAANRKVISKANKGKLAWNKGKPGPNKGRSMGPHSEEWRRNISKAKKGKPCSEECKQKISKANTDKIWITNGKTSTKIPKDEPIPKGWWRGRNSVKGTIWITDSKTSKRIRKDEPIPDGWRQGRKPKTA